MLFNSLEGLFEDYLKNNLEDLLIFLNNPVFNTDSYKLGHKNMEPEGTELIYSNLTPRFNSYFKAKYPDSDDKVVVFGLQSFLIQELIDAWNKYYFSQPLEKVMAQLELIFYPYLGMDLSKLQHFKALHQLGYLPIRIKALPEGTVVKLNTPIITIQNTHKDFSFLPNYVESTLSYNIHKPLTVATIAREFSKLTDYWYDKTVSDQSLKKFAIHDFSLRGHDSKYAASICGAAALLYSNGTDNVPGYVLARTLYGAGSDVAYSVSATEHSVTTLGINFYKDVVLEGEVKELTDQLLNRMIALGIQSEFEQAKGELVTLYRLLTERFPSGLLSYVADSYDFWRVIKVILPILKDVINRRDGKLVIRPDSGDPVNMVCGHKVTDLSEYPDFEAFTASPSFHQKFDVIKVKDIYYRDDSKVDASGEFIKKYTVVTEDEVKGSVEVLSEIFGYTTNDKGYKELTPKIGLIYGDGITYQRAKSIFENLAHKEFSAANVVLGVGSYTFAYTSRDDLGIAVKATLGIVNGVDIPIYKEPKTGDGSKKSSKGYLKVDYNEAGEIVLLAGVTKEEEDQGLFETVFENSKLYNLTTLPEAVSRLD